MKVLVVRFSAIGDIILTTPVVRMLSKQLKAEVHFLTKKKYADVLNNNPYITKRWAIEAHINEVVDDLKSEKFDLLIDLHNNLRTLLLKRQLGVAHRSFNKVNIQKWLKTNLKVDFLPSKHIVDRYAETVTSFSIKSDGKGLDYFVSDEILNKVRNDMNEIGPYIAMNIGAAHDTKCLPVDKQLELIRQLKHPVVLIGGSGEKDRAQKIISEMKVINKVGNCTLEETAAIIVHSAMTISHDTGTMHMGAALKKPMAVIWGNTVPQFGMGPYYGAHEIKFKNFEVDRLSCRPCSKIGYKKCPKSHFRCMKDQRIDEIAAFCNEFIDE